jgi:thiol-disulfide isomerase/thioredoxin
MKTKPSIISAAFILLVLAGCANNRTENNNLPVAASRDSIIEQPAAATATASLPVFSLQDLKGNSIDIQSLKGKKLFVNLWATWCPPCRREMPSIEKLLKSVDTSKVAFVIISLDDRFDKAKKYILNQKLDLPIFYPAQELPPLFNVDGIPSTFIFDEQGALIKQIEGSEDYNTEAYRKLLKG